MAKKTCKAQITAKFAINKWWMHHIYSSIKTMHKKIQRKQYNQMMFRLYLVSWEKLRKSSSESSKGLHCNIGFKGPFHRFLQRN